MNESLEDLEEDMGGLGGESLYALIPITLIYSAIFISGVVGNISTCVVITRNKHMHTATNYYLFSLAVSDLLLLVSGLPQEFYQLWTNRYVFGDAYCVLNCFVAETCANATVLTITAFTVERYIAICHPFLSHTVTKLSRAVKFVLAIWLLALCLAVPQAIQFGVVRHMRVVNETWNEAVEEGSYCTFKMTDSPLWHAFEISTFVFFVTPMTLITVLYLLIGFKLRRTRLIKRPSLSSMASREARGQNHVVRMLVAVVVGFFICWAPFHAQRLLAIYTAGIEEKSSALVMTYTALTYISGVLYYMSTCINPFLYNIMSHKFREAFKFTLADMCGRGGKRRLPARAYSVLSRANTEMLHQGEELGRRGSFNRRVRHPPPLQRANTISYVKGNEDVDCGTGGSELVHYMGDLNNR